MRFVLLSVPNMEKFHYNSASILLVPYSWKDGEQEVAFEAFEASKLKRGSFDWY